MAYLTKWSNQSKVLAILVCFLVVVPLLIYVMTGMRNHSLLQSVKEEVRIEYDKIQLPNIVLEEKYIPYSKCNYDNKVKATRCSVNYTKYYATQEDVVDEFIRIDNYLTSLGWTYWSSHPDSRDEITRMLESGYPPFEIYVKEKPYNLKMHMTFFGEKGREFNNKQLIDLLDKYSKENKSVYSISISSDIVRR